MLSGETRFHVKLHAKKTIVARITKWLVKVDFLGGWERNIS